MHYKIDLKPGLRVKLSLMPRGVEHALQVQAVQVTVREIISDAERR